MYMYIYKIMSLNVIMQGRKKENGHGTNIKYNK